MVENPGKIEGILEKKDEHLKRETLLRKNSDFENFLRKMMENL